MSVPTDKIISETVPTSVGSSDTTLTDSGFYWLEKDGVKVLVSKALEEAGFANGFSTRLGGVSPFPENDLNLAGFDDDSTENIEENRKRFLNTFGGDYRLTSVWQVHGDSVKTVRTEKDVSATEEKHDGLISNLAGILVGVKTADCVPVLIGDPQTGSFAAVHAGWRGTAESIVTKAIQRMKTVYGTEAKDLICAIGPAAGCERYEIGQEVINAFESFPQVEKLLKPTRPGHALIDLHTANLELLYAAGVERRNIYAAPFCTMDRTDLFFSYRVEKSKFGRTGRLMSVIGKKQ
jgi:YfiH family protein